MEFAARKGTEGKRVVARDKGEYGVKRIGHVKEMWCAQSWRSAARSRTEQFSERERESESEGGPIHILGFGTTAICTAEPPRGHANLVRSVIHLSP